jgi:hypothetical protein
MDWMIGLQPTRTVAVPQFERFSAVVRLNSVNKIISQADSR